MAYWIKINGVKLPTPNTSPITEYDLDSAATGRPESGYMFRERVRSNLSSIDLSWNRLTVDEAKMIRNALTPAQFECTYRFLGEEVTKTMYAGDFHWTPVFGSTPDFDVKQHEEWALTVQLSEY